MSASHFLQNNTHSDGKTLNTLVYIRHRNISRCHFLAIPKHWLSNDSPHEPIGSTQPSGAQTHDCLIVDTPIRFKQIYKCSRWAAVAEGVEWSSSNLKVGSSIPSSQKQKSSLSKMPNPELCLIEQQSAANRCTVRMCVWLGECKTVL